MNSAAKMSHVALSAPLGVPERGAHDVADVMSSKCDFVVLNTTNLNNGTSIIYYVRDKALYEVFLII